MAHPALLATAHRPWPLPPRPWALAMDWVDLAFLHWRVEPGTLQRLLPAGLVLETFAGAAWLGVVPFRMTHTRLRCLPPVPTTNAYAELNVRTYVRCGDVAGVWFFSLDVPSTLTVLAARAGFGLAYFRARNESRRDGDRVVFRSERIARGAPPAAFAARWHASAPFAPPANGTLAHFLTERYCLFAERRGRIVRGDIAHPPWLLAPAALELERCDVTRLLGVELSRAPDSVLAAAPQRVLGWAPRPVRRA
jgi:uncharacterized protein YqjF (DUF2071 family)